MVVNDQDGVRIYHNRLENINAIYREDNGNYSNMERNIQITKLFTAEMGEIPCAERSFGGGAYQKPHSTITRSNSYSLDAPSSFSDKEIAFLESRVRSRLKQLASPRTSI